MLEIDYVEKFYLAVDYKATFRVFLLISLSIKAALDDPAVRDCLDSPFARYLRTVLAYISIAIGHKIAFRTGDFELQVSCLSTFAPLVIAAGKDRYSASIAHFLTDLDSLKPGLYDALLTASVDNTSACGRYFALDEILEVNVGMTKRTLNPRTQSEEAIKLHLKSAQAVSEAFDAICNDLLPSWAETFKERVVCKDKDIFGRVQRTALDLVAGIKGDESSASLCGLKKSPSYSKLEDLITGVLYKSGVRRMESICRQDVLCVEERDATGRRSAEFIRLRRSTARV